MNNIKKAVKMYLKITIRPFFTSCGMIMLALELLFFLTVDPAENNLWRVMTIMSCNTKFFGIYTLLFSGIVSMTGNRFFASLPFSKELYMKVHLSVLMVITLLFDILVIVIASLRWSEEGLINLMILLPIGSSLVNVVLSTIGKQKIGILALAGLFFVMIGAFAPSVYMNLLNIDRSVTAAVVIGALIYIAGFAVTLLLNHIWWKHFDHIKNKKSVATL